MAEFDGLNYGRFDVIGDVEGVDEVVMSFQMLNTGGVSVTYEQALDDFEEFIRALWTLIEAIYTTTVVFRRITGKNESKGELMGGKALIPALAGFTASALCPRQATAVLSFPTVLPRVITKKMFGPLSVNAIQSNGTLTTGVQAMLAAAGAFMLLEYTATNTALKYGSFSPKKPGWIEPTGWQFITAPGARRSRKPGVGS